LCSEPILKESGLAIANDLLLSSHAIDTHRENIKRKLGLKNAAELNRHGTIIALMISSPLGRGWKSWVVDAFP
jgi:hypothetical protein